MVERGHGYDDEAAAGAANNISNGLNRLFNRLGPPSGGESRTRAQLIGRTLRRQPDTPEVIGLIDTDRLSLEDAQKLGFLPTFRIVPEAGTLGAGQYVRGAETEASTGNYEPILPKGYLPINKLGSEVTDSATNSPHEGSITSEGATSEAVPHVVEYMKPLQGESN